MGSRLKQNPERSFIWFFEALCPVTRDADPGVLFQFPTDFKDEDSSQALPRFCFPYDIQRVRDGAAVQHFTFVLTDLEGCQRFGFCRLTNSTNTCLCILSYLPWFEVFYKLLNSLADYLLKRQTNEMKALLALIYEQPIPMTVGSIALQIVPFFVAPDPRSLPSIPENRNLTELIVAVNVGSLLQVYASMLFERRILLCARKLSTLTACMHALSALLYPMYWQHIFIPVLPPHLLDYCCAPMPYLIGVHSSLFEGLRNSGLEDVVILDVDSNTVESPFDDLKRIPANVVTGLKVCLKRRAMSTGCCVSQAFLRAQALLFGGYRDALQKNQDGEICFSEELFLNHKSASVKPFLQSAIHLQFFKQFIDSRLELLNKGKDPDDLFEALIKHHNTTGRGKSCQQLVGNLKKGGGSLIHNMKTKANAKWLTTSSVKNLLVHKRNHNDPAIHRGGSVSHHRGQSECLQSRLPITQHFGRSRPQRPVHKKRHEEKKEPEDQWDRGVPGLEAEMEPHEREEEEQEVLLSDLEELDLLGEIFDTLSSHEPRKLYGTRSLDLFGPDSHDFITKRPPDSPSQQSLSMSINGSLYSWNLDSTEDSDPEADFSLQEEEKADREENAGIKDVINSKEEEEEVEGGVNVTGLENDQENEGDQAWGGDGVSERAEQEEEEAIKQTDDEEKQEDEEESQETMTEGGMCESPEPPAPTEKDESAPECTIAPPKVMSAVARFQSQPPTRPNFQLRPMSKTLCEAAAQSGGGTQPPEEDSCVSLSVSELKKRFEA
ncbi:DENN domain-containing protein 1C [Oryzias melastigma]|uniref:DENN domain-containing protein 1C n=1 Tax=Oryzias melastigma TaxID=30732 RepID=A0A834L2H4_ORYME|nr:DENN domain-containing protein 1C [Oryzias melastigma]